MHETRIASGRQEQGVSDAYFERLSRLESEVNRLRELEPALEILQKRVASLMRDNAVLQCGVSVLERRYSNRPIQPHHP